MPIRVDPTGEASVFEAATPAEFARLFRLPPAEAVAYMQGRERLKITYDWRELWHDEHARQFTVSRLARADLLQSLRDGIEKSVGGDLTRRDWMKNARALLEKEGWWGTRQVTRPDGSVVETTFNPRRLQLIYDVNTRMAYAAGRWQRVQAAKESHPYLRYVTRADERVRASHAAWHNVTLPVDDPWWQTHYPPNGWRCRCRAVPMRAADYAADTSLKKTAPPEEWVGWTNKQTGEVMRVPKAIDPGFAYNVGEARARWQSLVDAGAQKVAGYAASIGAAAAADLQPMARRAWAGWIEEVIAGREKSRLGWLGVISPLDLAHLKAAGIDPASAEMMVRPGIVRGPKAARHEAAGNALSDEQWRSLPDAFANPAALLLDLNSGKPLYLLPGENGAAQLAVEVDFVTAKPKRVTNAVKSAYGVRVETMRQRLKDGTIRVLWGSLE